MSGKQGGLDGYRGFEYQIDASIWIALDLMLKTERIDSMLVEPENSEDVEAMLTSAPATPPVVSAPDEQSATVTATAGNGRRMLYQMKTRSTGPWTEAKFGEVVGDGLQPAKPKKGPTPRARALKLLLDDRDAAYMFITNAGVEATVFKLQSETLHADGSAAPLPPGLLDTSLKSRIGELAGRVHVLPGLTSELLNFRIIQVLVESGKVPHVSVERCVKAMKDVFRARLLGTMPPVFERAELVRILRAHDGLSDSREDPFYVAPADLSGIEARLAATRWIVLVGPPGAGKTMLATHLAHRHRAGKPPFKVVWEHSSLGPVNEHINSQGPTMLIIGDLWGTSTYTGVTTLAHDLFGFIDSASPAKRFVITIRDDIYAKLPAEDRERIADHVVELSDQSYGDDKRWAIFINAASVGTEHAAVLETLRTTILARLRLPVALRKCAQLVADHAAELALLPAPHNVNPVVRNSRLVDTWLDAAVDATFGAHVRHLLQQWPHELGEHVVLLWLLSEAGESIDIAQLRELAAAIRNNAAVRLRPVEFVAFLVNNDLAKVSNGELRIHSLVLEKMAAIVRERPALADEFAVGFLSIILLHARDDRALARMERIAGVIRTLYSEPQAQADGWDKLVAEFDRLVEEACLSADPDTFLRGVYTGMWLPWTHSPFVELLRSLEPGESDTTPAWYGTIPSPEFVADVKQKNSLLVEFLPRFVAEFVPSTHIWYAYEGGEFVAFIRCFDVPLEDAARKGLAAMEREAYAPVPQWGWNWEPDHNAPALLEMLPEPERAPIAERLNWCLPKGAAGSTTEYRRAYVCFNYQLERPMGLV